MTQGPEVIQETLPPPFGEGKPRAESQKQKNHYTLYPHGEVVFFPTKSLTTVWDEGLVVKPLVGRGGKRIKLRPLEGGPKLPAFCCLNLCKVGDAYGHQQEINPGEIILAKSRRPRKADKEKVTMLLNKEARRQAEKNLPGDTHSEKTPLPTRAA